MNGKEKMRLISLFDGLLTVAATEISHVYIDVIGTTGNYVFQVGIKEKDRITAEWENGIFEYAIPAEWENGIFEHAIPTEEEKS